MTGSQPTLGGLMCALRARNNWTLKEISARTGIPPSTLAKVEHGRLTLSYDTLLLVSRRLNMRISELFAEPTEDQSVLVKARRSIGTVDQAERVDTRNYDYLLLCPDLRRKQIAPLIVRVRARSLSEFGKLTRHPGEEVLYVLNGQIELHSEFYEPVTLGAGEFSYVDSTMRHAYILAPGCDEATAVSVCSSAGNELIESMADVNRAARSAAAGSQSEDAGLVRGLSNTATRKRKTRRHS